MKIKDIKYAHLNHIASNAMSLITSYRFSTSDSNLRSLCCNLTPFPRLHFYTCNLAPILPEYSTVPEVWNQVTDSNSNNLYSISYLIPNLHWLLAIP